MTLRLLFVKLGSNPETRPIVESVRERLGNTFIAGVEELLDTPDSVYDEILTSHDDALFGAYTKMNLNELAMTPDLYKEVREFEGQALRMVGRIKYHVENDYLRGRAMATYDDSFQARADLVFRHSLFWNEILRKYQFDAVISMNFSHLGWDLPLVKFCRNRRIPHLIFTEVGQYPGFQFVQESVEEFGDLTLGLKLRRLCEKHLSDGGQDRITSYFGHLRGTNPPPPDSILARRPVAQGKSFKTGVIKAFLASGEVRGKAHGVTGVNNPLITKLKRLTSHPLKSVRGFRRTFVRMRATRRSMKEEKQHWAEIPGREKYVYFPLHFQPEASTSAKGHVFVDQREAVALVAASLPPNWLLVVKEHPHQWRRLYPRSPNYWEKISTIPKVRVVPHNSDNHRLMGLSEGVVSISHTTIAAEAWATGKKVLFLGYSHLWDAPGITSANSIEELRNFWLLPYIAPTEDQLRSYLNKLKEGTFEATLYGRPRHLTMSESNEVIKRSCHNITEVILAWLATKGLSEYP